MVTVPKYGGDWNPTILSPETFEIWIFEDQILNGWV